jgi:hypothetical protein
MSPLCTFVDDSVDEATALANQLRKNGVPFDICTVSPASTTLATYRLITAAAPRAAMVDYCLTSSPGTNSEDLASRLLKSGVPTVVVTKDRDVADCVTILCAGRVVPVFSKHRLINDMAYVGQLVQNLGGQLVMKEETDYTERLHLLQAKELHSALSRKEREELRTLLARLRLEESEEASCIEKAQATMQANLDSLIELVRELTTELNDDLSAKNAVSKKKRRT